MRADVLYNIGDKAQWTKAAPIHIMISIQLVSETFSYHDSIEITALGLMIGHYRVLSFLGECLVFMFDDEP